MTDIVTEATRLQELHKLSDRQFSRRLGVDQSGWSRIRRGKKQPGLKVLNALVREFPELRLAVFNHIGADQPAGRAGSSTK